MMRPKRIIIPLLVVVLLTFCALTAFASTGFNETFEIAVSAEPDAAILGVDNTFGVQKDSEVDFSVTADAGNAPFAVLMLTVTYDHDALELTADGIKISQAYDGASSITNDDEHGKFEINYLECRGMGELASFSLKVKDVHGDTSVTVEAHVFDPDTWEEVPVTLTGATTTIGVHSYGEAKPVAPDCDEGGYTYRACTIEGCEEKIIIERTNPLGHDESGADATCMTDKVCNRDGCDEVLVEKSFGAHDYSGPAATCTTDKFCAREGCGELLEERLGHDESGAAATCTTDKVCARGCGEVLAEKKGHQFGEWVVEQEPTMSDVGIEARTCPACGARETQEIPEKSSTWLVVLIIVLVIIVLDAGGFAVYWFLIKKKASNRSK